MAEDLRLSVNVDHVATLRQARGVEYPDPVAAAAIAEAAGASGITVHLRGDRRHIQERDVETLRRQVQGKLNLEMAATEEMIAIALALEPHQVTLVPERPEELTTEGGLDLTRHAANVEEALARLTAGGIQGSVFLDPDPQQLHILADFAKVRVAGFEINTDAYTRARGDDVARELQKVREAATLGESLGFRVFGGHGLTAQNVGPVAAVAQVEELNIGHAIVCRAVLVGMDRAVREMLTAMAEPSRAPR